MHGLCIWRPHLVPIRSLVLLLSSEEALTDGPRFACATRALIVDDEYLFALSLAADMQALGFDICDIAANRQDAFLQAMEDAPDIVLMAAS